jgi:hypothetical protein
MGFGEIVFEDGTSQLFGDAILPRCVACNDIPEIDDKVVIVGINPIRWKCNRCGCVCDFPKA